MDERHDNEQYFFDTATRTSLLQFLNGFAAPCCICCPTLGRAAAESGLPVTILDIDERFATLPGFRTYDLNRPEWLVEEFDVIICDPPFYGVSLAQLERALHLLAHHDRRTPLLVSYLTRRGPAVCRAFQSWNLQSTGVRAGYETVEDTAKNEIEWFSNLEPGRHEQLLAAHGQA